MSILVEVAVRQFILQKGYDATEEFISRQQQAIDRQQEPNEAGYSDGAVGFGKSIAPKTRRIWVITVSTTSSVSARSPDLSRRWPQRTIHYSKWVAIGIDASRSVLTFGSVQPLLQC